MWNGLSAHRSRWQGVSGSAHSRDRRTSVWRLLQWERENLKNIHKDQIKISYEALIRLDRFPKDILVVTSAYQLKICERAATSHLLQPLINGGWDSTLCSTGLFHSELQLYATLVSVKLILSQNVIYKYSGKCTTPNNDIILKTCCRWPASDFLILLRIIQNFTVD